MSKNKHHCEGHKQDADGSERKNKTPPRPVEALAVIVRAVARPVVTAASVCRRGHTSAALPSPGPLSFNCNRWRDYRHVSSLQLVRRHCHCCYCFFAVLAGFPNSRTYWMTRSISSSVNCSPKGGM